ncbi:hypothetical protein GJU40_19225 [Bacillus lacus]|uniref:Exosporium protein C n=1 Tax=Metabacillus lacus TaxID=1983721 RepID=A0A7X2M064_9BACI|nr:hypothetical protein [Metabacillus lacus]MRX74256.1 hypothetical protein [Metabacillus lacus]
MARFTTGPIFNPAVAGVRNTQTLTVLIDNQNASQSSSVLIEGYFLNGTRTLYVQELVQLAPNQVVRRNYFAAFEGYEFVFNTSGPAADNIEISAWGKNAAGELVTAHRVVAEELVEDELLSL